MGGCDRLEKLMSVQRTVIGRHVDEHQWCNHFETRGEAVEDFIDQYGWVLREAFCEVCSEGKGCEAYAGYLARKKKD